jgi:hypothetical protein
MKQKKCKNCKEYFYPVRTTLEKYCMKSECIKVFVNIEKEKQWKKRKKIMKENLMTLSDAIKIAQVAFNAFIRKRDEHRRCISCGTYNGKMNAGHYQSVGDSPELRFHEDNVHKQCERCNTHLHGNPINYRIELINRIGVERVEFLERKDHPALKLTIAEVNEITAKYRKKIKEL